MKNRRRALIANGRDDGENDDRDDNEGEEDAIVRDVDEKPPKKLKRGMRMVKRSIMRTRSVTDSVEEPLPVKLVEVLGSSPTRCARRWLANGRCSFKSAPWWRKIPRVAACACE